ncbi:superfamily II DNA or RNA helicase [Natronocella acetinitrilica]|uniref:Superfamily II DNA or RNA helicase n=1 Tax=Natronocella acetinitrilica TaxID=414046 RepID=A0AAE3G527_9GAMM|nr:DEAD/DEAH box helicase family protein [Natronocella acetinitrilica]MCP1674548.1 superfamily II DNA or RNA helicase [Natronocella acetinitrilica]
MSSLALIESAGEKTPRDYQERSVEAVCRYLREGFRRILVKQPTGTGKTFTSKLLMLSVGLREALGIEASAERRLRVLFISHRARLNRQAAAEYAGLASVELITQSAFADIPPAVLEAGWDVTLIDEAHHEAMMSMQLLLDRLVHTPIIGLTADDDRGDGFLVKFERVVVPISEREAARRGFIERAGVNTVLDHGGSDKSALAIALVREYHRHMGNTIVFFRTEAECQRLAGEMRSLGLSHAVLTSEVDEAGMDAALERLASGEIQFLLNCMRIGEGIDCRNVTDVLLMRQFASRAEKKQFIGRAIRNDSPCAAWELQNPIIDSVAAKDCVGMTKYERLIYLRDGRWHETLLSGEDATWGQMAHLRERPDQPRPEACDDVPCRLRRIGGGALSATAAGINTNTDPMESVIRAARSLERADQLSLFGEADTDTDHQGGRIAA